MSQIILAPSVLGYESNLMQYLDRIEQILEAGAQWLHIDVMRPPFIPDKNAFLKPALRLLYDRFKDHAVIDFHLMVSDPRAEISAIDSIVGDGDRSRVNVTVHAEAFRHAKGAELYLPGDLSVYASKDYDLLADTGNRRRNANLRRANEQFLDLVAETLQSLKGVGYMTGIALEPGISLGNLDVDPRFMDESDMILLMSVISGAGGQKYHPEVTDKIQQAAKSGKMIQVDGGINGATLKTVIRAGATNLVLGSYITNEEDPSAQVKLIIQEFV